jgi:pimeloyl-ACP methyl ester carboxylesterase
MPVDLTAQDSDCHAGGHLLRVRSLGRWTADVPVLVFLHEGLGSITQWRDFPQALCEATGLPGLVYDRYGYGQSEPLNEPRPDDFLRQEAHTLADLLTQFRIGQPVILGHSDGGTIALMVAALYPDRIRAVVTEAAHVLFEPITRQGLSAVYERFQIDRQLQDGLARHHGANTHAMVTQWAQTWLRPSLADWSMLDMLPAITCPVLALQGSDDDHGSPQQLLDIGKGVSGPVDCVMLESCGHVPHFQARERVMAEISRFLSRVR